MRQRNDDPSEIEGREQSRLAYGEGFWVNHHSTSASLDSISSEDINSFHKRCFFPANFVVAVSGDFDRDQMIVRLERLFQNWPYEGKETPPIPTNTKFAAPGLYIVDKDVNQGRVAMMLPGIKRNDPDMFAVMVMNDILGGGGFTSRLVARVRSDEGLAYDAGSSFPGGVYYPLIFDAAYQSKSRTVAFAASIVIEEMKKIVSQPVSAEELAISKAGFIERFPRSFGTPAQIANAFAQEEFTGRYQTEPGFYKEYRPHIKAVTAADVQKVAEKYLTPEKLAILVVGNKSDILLGHPSHPVKLVDLSKGGLTDVPLRDPLTMKPMNSPK
jgi:predicted Zn-dependent peptidase